MPGVGTVSPSSEDSEDFGNPLDVQIASQTGEVRTCPNCGKVMRRQGPIYVCECGNEVDA